MDMQQLLALCLFAFISTVSPGPNNIMLMTSGANIGFARTLPHMLGIVLGFSFMLIMVGVGLTSVFHQFPMLYQILNILCIGYLFYLALKIAKSKSIESKEKYQPMSFLAAANFQWVNPKAWVMAMTAVTVYNQTSSWQGVLFIALVFALANIPSVSIWTYAGKQLQTWLNSPTRLQKFNYVMAGLLILSVIPMIV